MPQVLMRIATWWQMPDRSGAIRKTRLEKGKVYDVAPDVADRWIKRGIASPAEATKAKEAEK